MAMTRAVPAVFLPNDAAGVEIVAKFFRALGDHTRLRLLEFLLSAEHTVTECIAQVGVSQGRVSSHLACLADCGYVRMRREGRFAYYRVADRRVADLILLARALATDNATTLAASMHAEARTLGTNPPDPAATRFVNPRDVTAASRASDGR